MNNIDIWKEISIYIPKGSWRNFVFTQKEFIHSMLLKKSINDQII